MRMIWKRGRLRVSASMFLVLRQRQTETSQRCHSTDESLVQSEEMSPQQQSCVSHKGKDAARTPEAHKHACKNSNALNIHRTEISKKLGWKYLLRQTEVRMIIKTVLPEKTKLCKDSREAVETQSENDYFTSGSSHRSCLWKSCHVPFLVFGGWQATLIFTLWPYNGII